MNRRILSFPMLAAAFAVATVIAASAATNATFIFKTGQRLSGEFRYNHDANLILVIDGRERVFPSDDIALIQFADGDPTAKEIAALSTDATPLEHDRHMLAFRDGRNLRGKIYDFQGDNLLIDVRDGNGGIARQTYPMNQVARLYMNAPASRNLFPAATTPLKPTADGVIVKVSAMLQWTDTGIDVRQGELISFSTGDQIQVDPRTPTGSAGTGSVGRQTTPVRTLGVGALIGRVGRTVKSESLFGIGANTQPIAMPAGGRLFLGVNDNRFDDNSGMFNVLIKR